MFYDRGAYFSEINFIPASFRTFSIKLYLQHVSKIYELTLLDLYSSLHWPWQSPKGADNNS